LKIRLTKGSFQEIRRTPEGGTERVSLPAYLAGGLAMRQQQYGWMILHANSGYKLLDVVGNKDLAVRVLEALLENHTRWEEWGFEPDPVAPPEARRAVQIAARVMFPDLPPVPPVPPVP